MNEEIALKVKKKKKRKLSVIIVSLFIFFLLVLSLIYPSRVSGREISVSMEIECSQVTNNPNLLKNREILKYLPETGMIMEKEECICKSGDTVYTLLEKECEKKHIPIDVDYTPAYRCHYIKGINYLYEFSCGKYSGWIYTVNGERSSYGADKRKLKNGDIVKWSYVTDFSER